MIKPIKFDLKLSNSETIATIDDLKNNLTIELFEHFHSGKLAKWLRVRKLEEKANAVENLLDEIHDREVQSFKSLIELFGGEADVDSLRIAIAERKKMLPSSIQNSDDEVEVEQLKAENEALKNEIEKLKNPSKPKIAEERIGQFIVYDDNTVLDTKTGLTWCRYAVGHNITRAAQVMTWDDAILSAKQLTLTTGKNWRLPTIDELKSIVVKERSPTVNQDIFPDTERFSFWSSSENHVYKTAHCVDFTDGKIYSKYKDSFANVRLVRR